MTSRAPAIEAATDVAVVVVGDVMVDAFAIIDGPLIRGMDHLMRSMRRMGGQAANTAAWLAQSSVPVHLVAACGDDDEGAWIAEELRRIGVHTHLTGGPTATGRCVIVVDAEGERTMFSDPGANVAVRSAWSAYVEHEQPCIASDRLHVHLSGYLLQRDPALVVEIAEDIGRNATLSLDTAAFAPTLDHARTLQAALPHLDVLLGTQHELSSLLRQGAPLQERAGGSAPQEAPEHVIGSWTREFPGTVVVKRGAQGASAGQGDVLEHVPASAANVVDTTGAGDAFTAGFLAAWVRDPHALAGALRSGADAASVAIARVGAGPTSREGR